MPEKSPKILIDSSTWVSFIIGDSNFTKALAMMRHVEALKATILLPTLVYGEVLNALQKWHHPNPKIAEQIILKYKGIKIIHPDINFWTKTLANYIRFSKLKTSDFLIIVHALEFGANDLFTLDKNLRNEYLRLRNNL